MKKISLIFLLLVALALVTVPVIAQEYEQEQGETIDHVQGSDAMHWALYTLDFIWLIIFGTATFMVFKLSKKLYGGRFTSALPYLAMGLSLLLAMPIIHLFGHFLDIGHSMPYMFGMQSLQVLAGIFFISAVYQIYQTRFATEGFMEVKK